MVQMFVNFRAGYTFEDHVSRRQQRGRDQALNEDPTKVSLNFEMSFRLLLEDGCLKEKMHLDKMCEHIDFYRYFNQKKSSFDFILDQKILVSKEQQQETSKDIYMTIHDYSHAELY